jgi:hypothetical protein
LLAAVACGLRELPTVQLDRLPRMADYAEWIQSCEPALGLERGTMVGGYERSRQRSTASTIEGSSVGSALVEWLGANPWEGTASELLAILSELVPDAIRRDSRRWPSNPRALSGTLRRLAPTLRLAGISIEWLTPSRTRRVVRIGRCGVPTVDTVATVAHAPIGRRSDGRDGADDRTATYAEATDL